jgi:hypothetical protein
METQTDQQLRQLAHKRVDFRRHLTVYLIINSVLWLLWYITGHRYPWPIWPMAGWGVGLVFHYLFDYRAAGLFSEEREFEKLKNKTSSNA